VLFVAALVVSALLQVKVYVNYGGISGFIAAFESGSEAFAGKGLLFAISESFPIVAMMGYAVYARSSRRTRGWIEIGLVVIAFVALKLLFGGLRGSRSNTIWGLFWAVGLVHLLVRPVSRKLILAGMIPLVLFMFAYGFYKSYGTDGLDVLREADNPVAAITETEGARSMKSTLLMDLGRIDVQAFLIYRTSSDDVPETYTYAHGRTYLGAAALLVPLSVWPDRPETKVLWGTNVIHGDGVYESGTERSSRVFGLAGETILNFGPYLVPFAFVILGLLVGWVHRAGLSWTIDDGRLLIYPMLVNLCVIVLTSDSDNIVYFIVKNGLVPIALVVASVLPIARGQNQRS
jgi:hypothetical protein